MITRHDNTGRCARARRPVGDPPAAPSTATSSLVGRSAPDHPGPQLLCRDRVHGPHVHPVAPAPNPGAGLRLTRHSLVAAEPVGHGRSVRAAPPGDPGPARRGGPAGLVARQPGQHERPRQAWGDHVGASPVDRGKPGSKLHLVCEGSGLPLTAAVTAANVPDVVMLAAVVDDIPPVRTRRAAGGSGQAGWTPTRATTARPTAPGCAGVGSGRGSLGGGSSPRPGWAASLAGGAGAVMAELLAAAAGPLGSGLGALVCVCAAGVRARLFQAALTPQHEQRLRPARGRQGMREDEAVVPLVPVWIVRKPGTAMPRQALL
jgi:hypothetical protein